MAQGVSLEPVRKLFSDIASERADPRGRNDPRRKGGKVKEIGGDVCRCVKRPGEIMQTDDMETHSVCGGAFVSRREEGKVIQEGRFSDVLSESQIARMNGNTEGRNAGIAEGLRMAEGIVWEYDFEDGDLKHLCNFLLAKAKEIEESVK